MEQKAYLYKKIAYLYKEKDPKKAIADDHRQKIIFFKQKKTGPSPMQNLERIFSPHPQVAMRCMHQSNLIG